MHENSGLFNPGLWKWRFQLFVSPFKAQIVYIRDYGDEYSLHRRERAISRPLVNHLDQCAIAFIDVGVPKYASIFLPADYQDL